MRTPRRMARAFVVVAMLASGLAMLPATPAFALANNPDTTWMTNGSVWATAQYGNVLFIGGSFTQVRSVPVGTTGGTIIAANNLAAIDMTTGQGIASFHPNVAGSGLQIAQIHALAVVGDTLYVGGQFSSIDGAAHYNLGALTIDPSTLTATVDNTFNPVAGVPGAANENKIFVYEILPSSDGLYIGGSFTKMNGTGRSKAAKITYAGALVKTWKVLAVNGAIRDMVFSTDGQTIFIAGAFDHMNKVAHQSIARVLATTGKDDPWTAVGVIVGGPSHPGMTCWSLAATQTRLFAGCGRSPNYAASFRLDNGDTGNMAWSFGTVGNVQSIALTSDQQSLVIGGHFGTFLTQQVCGNKYLKNLGILHNLYGTSGGVFLDCNFLPQFKGPNPFGGVWEIQVTPTAIWAGGEFHDVNCDPSRSDTLGGPGKWTCTNGRGQESIARFTL